MSASARNVSRISWLDGLRGLAAIQVLFLHYANAFLPAIGFRDPRLVHVAWERVVIGTPLSLPFDGVTAVDLFFIMSGAALTFSFGNSTAAILPTVLRRFIRLGLPMAAAFVLAAILFALLPDAHFAAGRLSRPSWLAMPGPPSVSAAAIGRQIALEGLLTGYRGIGLLPRWGDATFDLVPLANSPNVPLWTLHIEFYGSLLVLTLVVVRASISPILYRATCLVLGFCFLASPMALFILGHLAAAHLGRTGGQTNTARMSQQGLGTAALVAGVLLSTGPTFSASIQLFALMPRPLLGPPVEPENLQNSAGAILIFTGLTLLPLLQRGLQRPSLRWLGKISFSVYLTHYPVLFTITAALFAMIAAKLSYGSSVAIASVAGIATTLLIAMVFERLVDRPAINLSRRFRPSRLITERSAFQAPATP